MLVMLVKDVLRYCSLPVNGPCSVRLFGDQTALLALGWRSLASVEGSIEDALGSRGRLRVFQVFRQRLGRTERITLSHPLAFLLVEATGKQQGSSCICSHVEVRVGVAGQCARYKNVTEISGLVAVGSLVGARCVEWEAEG